MNKWITTTIVIILAAAVVAMGILYWQENQKLKDLQSQVQVLQEDISRLYSVFPGLGQEFPLSIGQSTLIAGENLRLKFKDVTRDSRCPEGVVCITQGEAVCLLEIEQDGAVSTLELAQPGLYYDYTEKISGNFKYRFMLEPYPKVDPRVADYEYRLLITVSR
jgi:hypothetical protein